MTSPTDPSVIAAAENIARMSDEELRQVLAVLKLDTTGTHDQMSDRVLAHTDLLHVARVVRQVKLSKSGGGGWYYSAFHRSSR